MPAPSDRRPPFGKKSSMSFTNADGEQETDDLTYNRSHPRRKVKRGFPEGSQLPRTLT